jgi:hypothetical protein
MAYLKNFLLFWYDFVVGDDWTIAVGVVLALIVSALLAANKLNAWWVMPAAVVVVLVVSLWRETHRRG